MEDSTIDFGDFFKGPLPGKFLKLLGFLALSRLGVYIPLGGVNQAAFAGNLDQNSLLGTLDSFSGGGIGRLGICSLGIVPFINAQIVFQLLTQLYPKLQELQKKEGEAGRKKILQYTRYASVGFAIAQAIGQVLFLRPYVNDFSTEWVLTSVTLLTLGSVFTTFLGETISELKLGNGTSLLIFTSIISYLPASFGRTVAEGFQAGNYVGLLTIILSFFFLVLGIVYVQEAERKIPLNYASRYGSRTGGPQRSAYLPFKSSEIQYVHPYAEQHFSAQGHLSRGQQWTKNSLGGSTRGTVDTNRVPGEAGKHVPRLSSSADHHRRHQREDDGSESGGVCSMRDRARKHCDCFNPLPFSPLGGRGADSKAVVNSSGVMPIIFSTSSLALPATLARFTGLDFLKKAAIALTPGGSFYLPTNVLLIAFFNYYYTFLQLDPDELSEQLKRTENLIPPLNDGYRRVIEHVEKAPLLIEYHCTRVGCLVLIWTCSNLQHLVVPLSEEVMPHVAIMYMPDGRAPGQMASRDDFSKWFGPSSMQTFSRSLHLINKALITLVPKKVDAQEVKGF
uniref:Preprotein translocase subunit secY, chloroplastic n=1 Tax=Aegilops tauschii TaxID=37682 RepID=M8BJF6_AEGTA